MCENLLLLALPVVWCFVVLPVRPKRALFAYSWEYALNIVFFAVMFLQWNRPCIWNLLANLDVVEKGVGIGVLFGFVLGVIGVTSNISPNIEEGIIESVKKGKRAIRSIRGMLGGGVLFVLLWVQRDGISQLFRFQELEQCVNFIGGVLVGYFLGLLLLECSWILYWEFKHNHRLYIEGIEMNQHWIRGWKS